MDRHQIPFYLAGIVVGAVAGLLVPAVAHPTENAILPVLALLLYVTFLGVPFGRIGHAFRDWKFLMTTLVVNFTLVPIIVWVLSRIVAHNEVLLVGVLVVLLTPCIDYVIVFTGLAGGDQERILAAAPLLMIVQMLMLPLFLWWFVGAEFVGSVDFAPFVEAFVFIIGVPLGAALLTQSAASRTSVARRWEDSAKNTMVPLMVITLAAVVASQIAGVAAQLAGLLLTVPVYVLFAAIMVPVGMIAGRVSRLDIPGQRAIVFSGTTRNSLVVLPLVLALPAAFDLAPLVVVTQTLVELVIMVIFIRLIPRLIRQRSPHAGEAAR